MTRTLVAFAFSVFLAATVSAASAACWNDNGNAAATGQLAIGQFKDAADRPETAFILTLGTPACLASQDPDNRVAATTTIHIYASAPALHERIKQLVGRKVAVRGQPFAAHTSHHHAPIVMNISAIEPAE